MTGTGNTMYLSTEPTAATNAMTHEQSSFKECEGCAII